MSYSGWKNRATWNVALWLSNDEGLYNLARYFVRNLGHRCTGRDAEMFMHEVFPSHETPDGDSIFSAHPPEIAALLRDLA